MNKNEKYEILAYFLGHFREKKWLLAKFLIDNDAINEQFLERIQLDHSENIEEFTNVTQLNDYLNKLIDNESKTHRVNLEDKLKELIEQEKYEEAARIRDWLKDIKRRK